MQYHFRPISAWPGAPTRNRRRSNFSATYSHTLRLLDRELSHLRAKNVVIECDTDESQIRMDGMLRSNARLNGPGIILSFDSRHGPLRYPCDNFLHWDCNLRAIGLALEALRKVDRYGVTKRAEQYTGWKALPPSSSNGHMDAQAAAEWMARERVAFFPADDFEDTRATLMESHDGLVGVFRELAKKLHPDAGGDSEKFKTLTAAKKALETAQEARRR
jgi:hypothetical protein